MKHRRLFFVRPLPNHAEGHLEVTTIVVVVIDIYLYDYYYRNSHTEVSYGLLPARAVRYCTTVLSASRENVQAIWLAETERSIRSRGPHQLRRLR